MRSIVLVVAAMLATPASAQLHVPTWQDHMNSQWSKVDERLRRELRTDAVRQWEMNEERDWRRRRERPAFHQGFQFRLHGEDARGMRVDVRPTRRPPWQMGPHWQNRQKWLRQQRHR